MKKAGKMEMDCDCDRCLYKNVVEGLSEGFSRIDVIHLITKQIADKISALKVFDKGEYLLSTQAAVVAVDTILICVDKMKERGELLQP